MLSYVYIVLRHYILAVNESFAFLFNKYQPSGKGGTRSLPLTPHHLHRRTACNAALPATPQLLQNQNGYQGAPKTTRTPTDWNANRSCQKDRFVQVYSRQVVRQWPYNTSRDRKLDSFMCSIVARFCFNFTQSRPGLILIWMSSF